MNSHLTLTQLHIRHFLDCPRRFELRYLAPFTWPEAPYTLDTEQAFDRGRYLHRLLERHFLELHPEAQATEDAIVQTWWDAFSRSGIHIPAGRRLPELSLAASAGGHQLFGRFDLLVLSPQPDDEVSATVFDWKTSKPRDVAWLSRAWQTRLYLALLAEGGHTLVAGRTQKLDPDRLAMVYWYVAEPHAPRVIRYSRTLHEQNWGEITRIVAAIDQAQASGLFPLTEDWSRCRGCAFQAYCGRQTAGTLWPDTGDEDDLDGESETDTLEPGWN